MADQFLEIELARIEQEIIGRIRQVNLATLTDIELAQLFAEIDILSQSSVTELEKGYNQIITRIASEAERRNVNFAGFDKDGMISRIYELDAAALFGRAEMYSNSIKSRFLKGIINGQDIRTIADSLDDIGLATNETIALINTAKSQMERATLAEAFKDEPDQRFILEGGILENTRPACLAVLNYQPKEGFTMAEINNGAATKLVKEHDAEFAKNKSSLEYALKTPYSFVDCGGFNCIHNWEPV